jgi:RNA polymerase sigma-70 factor (ECF subfamily)
MGDTSPAMINDSNAMVVPLDSATDDELVAAAKANDERAFELLVKRYQPKLLAIVLRYVRVREDAEDVVQQTFQSAFIHLHRFESKSAISSWLTRIAINEALMLLRKRRTRWELSIGSSTDHELSSLGFDLSDSRFDPEANYLGREKRDMLSAAIAKLGPRLRLAIELRELQELSTQDTARSMGVSVAAVKARVFNGRKKLQGAFRGFEMSLNAQKSYSS